jgi:hypothetical protein
MTDEQRPEDGFQARARIGPRGSTRRPLVATGVVAALLVVAVVKPWSLAARPAPSPAPGSPSPVAAASLRAGPSAAVESTPPTPADAADPEPDDALVAVTDERVGWGMRAIVQRRIPPSPLLAEQWASASVPPAGPAIPGAFDGIPLEGPLSDVGDSAYALGVTTPQDALPLDLRFWRANENRGWARLLPVPFAGREPGSWLWRPDPTWATTDGAWPSGTYRVDVLLGTRIVRLEAVVSGTFAANPRVIMPGALDAPISTALEGMPLGPFALTEFGPSTIPLAGSGSFDERTAWLAPYLGAGYIAAAYGNVNGLGVLGSAGDAPEHLSIEQVSGFGEPSSIAVDVSSVTSPDGSKVALFARPLGGYLFADALHRIIADWPGGRREAWEIEVAPGPAVQVPRSPLEAVSRWNGLLSTDDISAPIVRATGDVNEAVPPDECDPRTRIRSVDALIGVTLPAASRLTGIRALVPGAARAPDWRFWFGSGALQDLAVVAVPFGGLPARDYDLVLDLDGPDGPSRVVQRICVGD